MARKRMIKPEFWTDSTMVQLPVEARLLFIGMWNFADDYGYIEDEPDRLALQILPADDADVEMLLDLLIAAGRVERYRAPDGLYFLYIPHFATHQKVDHPAKPTFPDIAHCTKQAIPLHVRRQVAVKYGCEPGERGVASCYYCGIPGGIYWPRTRKGQPGAWVAFSGLELDHFVPESEGGPTQSENIVLACRTCNRSKHTLDGIAFSEQVVAKPREDSRAVPNVSPQVKVDQVKLSQAKEANDARARLELLLGNPDQAAAAVAAAVRSRGDFTLDEVASCEAYVERELPTFPKAVGALYNLLKAGKLPTPPPAPRANGHRPGKPTARLPAQPDLHWAEDASGKYLALPDGSRYEVPDYDAPRVSR